MRTNPFEPSIPPPTPEKLKPEERITLLDMQIESAYENYRIMVSGIKSTPEKEESRYEEPLKLRTLRLLAGKPMPSVPRIPKVSLPESRRTEMARLALDLRYQLKRLIEDRELYAEELDSHSRVELEAKSKTRDVIRDLAENAELLEKTAQLEQRIKDIMQKIGATKDASERSIELIKAMTGLNKYEANCLAIKMADINAGLQDTLVDNIKLFDESTRTDLAIKSTHGKWQEQGIKETKNKLKIIKASHIMTATNFTKYQIESLEPKDEAFPLLTEAYVKRMANGIYEKGGRKDHYLTEDGVFARRGMFENDFGPEPQNFDKIKKSLYLSMIKQYITTLAQPLHLKEPKDPKTDSFVAKEIIHKTKAVVPLLNKEEILALEKEMRSVCPEIFDWKGPSWTYAAFYTEKDRKELTLIFEKALQSKN